MSVLAAAPQPNHIQWAETRPKDENANQRRLEREPYLPIQEGTSSALLVILVMKPGNCRSQLPASICAFR